MKLSELLSLYKKTADAKPPKPTDIISSGELSLSIERIPFSELLRKHTLVKKIAALSASIAQSLPSPTQKVAATIAKREVEEARAALESAQPVEEKEELVEYEEEKQPSPPAPQTIIEKVVKKPSIPYITSHKQPKISFVCSSEPIAERAKKVVGRILSATTTKTADKAELSKKLITLTRAFLKASSKEERARIKKEIAEVKALLETGKAKADPLDILLEEQKESLKKVIADMEEAFGYAIEEANKAYEEARSVASEEEMPKVEEMREEDKNYIISQLNEFIKVCKSYLLELHRTELELLSSKTGKDYSKIISSLNQSYTEAFEGLKERLLSKLGVSPAEKKEAEIEGSLSSLRREILSFGDAAWLHYLGSKNRKLFWKYVRGELSKKDAIRKAKELYAKERAEALGITLSEAELEELIR